MQLFMLEPEVAGGLGEGTIFNVDKEIEFLHYEFQGWLGDELLESSPCYVVSDSLAQSMISARLTGFRIEDIDISVTQEFTELYPDRGLPAFRRLVPLGRVSVDRDKFLEWSGDDICFSQKKYLVVSEKAFAILNEHKLENCDFTRLIG